MLCNCLIRFFNHVPEILCFPIVTDAGSNDIPVLLCMAFEVFLSFNLPEGVSVTDVYQDNSYATFVDEDGNFTNENITSDNVYVIVYSDGTRSVHEVVGTKFNHDSINKANGDDTAGMMVDYLTSKGREYYGGAD